MKLSGDNSYANGDEQKYKSNNAYVQLKMSYNKAASKIKEKLIGNAHHPTLTLLFTTQFGNSGLKILLKLVKKNTSPNTSVFNDYPKHTTPIARKKGIRYVNYANYAD